MTPIPEMVRELGVLTPKQRKSRLQDMIGPRTADSAVLQWRALLMTALNDAGVWPPRDGVA